MHLPPEEHGWTDRQMSQDMESIIAVVVITLSQSSSCHGCCHHCVIAVIIIIVIVVVASSLCHVMSCCRVVVVALLFLLQLSHGEHGGAGPRVGTGGSYSVAWDAAAIVGECR